MLQSAIEKALSRSEPFRPGTRIDSWMFRIIQTTWLDRRRSAERLIARLPEAQRAVPMPVTIEGVSYREASEIPAIPIGTMMSRLARARLALGQALDDRMEAAE